jgi:hypothetical protein
MPTNNTERNYASLVAIEGFILLEPISPAHRSLLWTTVDNSFTLSERSLVYDSVKTLANAHTSYRDAVITIKAAYADLRQDKIIVPDNSHIINYQYGVPTVELSKLGVQIATESARRALVSPNSMHLVKRRAKRIYTLGLGMMLSSRFSHTPDPAVI